MMSFKEITYYSEDGNEFIIMKPKDLCIKIPYNLFSDLLVLNEWVSEEIIHKDYLHDTN